MSVKHLLLKGFTPVGSWKTPDCRPYKMATWLHYQPGLYAFAIGADVMYVGLAKTLHRRLRNYGNRAFRNKVGAQRWPHIGIAVAISEHIKVTVLAKVFEGANEDLLLHHETKLIVELQPPWNGTHRKAGA